MPDDPNDGDGEYRGNEEAKPPVNRSQDPAQQHNADTADVVRRVPDREFGGELAGWKPIRQQPGARRKTHSLNPAISHPKKPKRQHARAQTEGYVQKRGGQQSYRHENAGVGAVGQKSISKLGDAVEDTVQREEQPKAFLGDAEFLAHERHGDPEILAHQIKRGIAKGRKEEDANLPKFVFLGDCGRVAQGHRDGWRWLKEAQPCPKSSWSARFWGRNGEAHITCVARFAQINLLPSKENALAKRQRKRNQPLVKIFPGERIHAAEPAQQQRQ